MAAPSPVAWRAPPSVGNEPLPRSIQNKKWVDKGDKGNSLTPAQRLLFKRAKLDVKIIKRQSDEISKYELFQRLNTGGTRLTEQELRNCLLVMVDGVFFKWLRELADYHSFQNCLVLTDNAIDEQYDLELVVRFIVLRSLPDAALSRVGDLGDFLTETIVRLAESRALDLGAEELAFKTTFDLLGEALGDNSFRRYDAKRRRFLGGFFVSGFEALALGVGHYHRRIAKNPPDLKKIAMNIWSDANFRKGARSGMRANERMRVTIPYGRKLFKAV